MLHLNSVSAKRSNFNLLILLLTIPFLSLISCRESDPVSYTPPEALTYDATSEWYAHPDVLNPNATPRTDAVGKWENLDKNVIFEVKSVIKNPKYLPNSTEPEYIYEISSKIPDFPLTAFTQVNEVGINKNNINLDNKYRLIVEGTRGWLWVMADHPYKIRIKRDNWNW